MSSVLHFHGVFVRLCVEGSNKSRLIKKLVPSASENLAALFSLISGAGYHQSFLESIHQVLDHFDFSILLTNLINSI